MPRIHWSKKWSKPPKKSFIFWHRLADPNREKKKKKMGFERIKKLAVQRD